MNDDRKKLKNLLEYWVEHNREHAQEFREWAEKARGMGEIEIEEEMLQAVGHMDRVTDMLTKTLGRLKEV